ncbi:MAG: ABC transporter permease [Phycisphaerales bacterium]|nr:ABC transporter permease [Phycisphaerales bacterium]
MMQTLAMLKDAYRELNHRKLFWITLAISCLVVAAFAMVGNDEKGLTILHWSIEAIPFSTHIISTADFYKLLFSLLGVQFWLGWFATILAIISTASIFPEFVGSGSIDLMLSKPIGRMRLFLTKYVTGLLFVTLQVTVFMVAAILVIGIRGGEWVPWLLVAIPLMVLFFSYLFCVQAVVGMITRSPIASIIAVAIFWMLCFGTQMADQVTLLGRTVYEIEVERVQKAYDSQSDYLQTRDPNDRADTQQRVDELKLELSDARDALGTWETVNTWLHATNTIMPKTGETTDLLMRILEDKADLDKLGGDEPERPVFGVEVDPKLLENRMNEELGESHSATWIIGTSLLFEAVILGLGGWWFVRRDF